jgi:hypothetical protein
MTSHGAGVRRDGGWPEVRGEGPAPPEVPGFELGDLLGVGSSGAVWSAVREEDGALLAVKVVRGAAGVALESASRELAVLGRAAADHVLRVHDAMALDGGDVVLVLDHMAGGSLGRVVSARGHLTPGEAVTVLSPVAAALGRLHAVGVVHGDVAPGNVLLDRTGRPVLGDLGTSHIAGEVVDEVSGTDGFLAPEVLAGGLPDAAADVYAVGALGWLCLTGSVPGPAPLRGSLEEALTRHGGPLGGGAGEPGYAALVPLIERCLDPDPARRPAADALAVAVFECTPPRPLPVASGPDDVSGLTHRLRAAAVGAPVEGPARRRFARRLRARAPIRGPRRRPARHGAARLPRGPLLAASGLILLLGVLTASLVLSRRTPAAADPVPVVANTTTTGTGDHADPTREPAAPGSNPAALLAALLERRAEAWRAGRVDRLSSVDAPGSAALARDTTLLTGVQQDGLRYRGLGFVVVSADVVTTSATAAVLRARVDTTAYVVEGPGADRRRSAAVGDPVLIDLVRTADGWRVADVREVPRGS